MKTFKFFAFFCFILAIPTNRAFSQKVEEVWIEYKTFPVNEFPCLTESISGMVIEYQFTTNDTYHAYANSILHGDQSGDEYEVSYHYNQFSNWGQHKEGCFTNIFPILIFHEGKLVMVCVGHWMYHVNANGELVVDRAMRFSNCVQGGRVK
jgi:hypothetical protein